MIRLRTLPNGMRVASDRVSGARSCAIGLWLQTGSRWERENEQGVTHFIEHMLFKGTDKLDARAIGEAINDLGGNVNAFTSQEQLCLHARTVAAKAPRALELLAALLLDSTFPVPEIGRERQVILEECKMYEDNPEELALEVFMRNLWPGHPLGHPIVGRRGSIRRFSRQRTIEHWRRELKPGRLLLALAGSFNPRAIDSIVARRFEPLGGDGPRRRPAQPDPARIGPPRRTCLRRDVEQAQFCLGTVGPRRSSKERYAFGMMNVILGEGVSSRLFREIRERRGLAYSIGSFTQSFSDAGSFAVSGGTSPGLLCRVLRITLDEIGRICEEDVTERELEMARSQVIDALEIGMENTEHRMMRLADSVLTHGRALAIEETVARLRGVDPAQVRAVARRHLKARPFAAGCVGPKLQAMPAAVERWPGNEQ